MESSRSRKGQFPRCLRLSLHLTRNPDQFGSNCRKKNSALEAESPARQAPPSCETQPHRPVKDSKGHRRAKLKAIADDLMARFLVLEVEQQPDVTPRTRDKRPALNGFMKGTNQA